MRPCLGREGRSQAARGQAERHPARSGPSGHRHPHPGPGALGHPTEVPTPPPQARTRGRAQSLELQLPTHPTYTRDVRTEREAGATEGWNCFYWGEGCRPGRGQVGALPSPKQPKPPKPGASTCRLPGLVEHAKAQSKWRQGEAIRAGGWREQEGAALGWVALVSTDTWQASLGPTRAEVPQERWRPAPPPAPSGLQGTLGPRAERPAEAQRCPAGLPVTRRVCLPPQVGVLGA